MPKMKTKAGAKKRFKVTGSGKLKRKHAFKSHILTKKETKQKRNLTKSGLVHKSDIKNVDHFKKQKFPNSEYLAKYGLYLPSGLALKKKGNPLYLYEIK